jgi:hypothetical protein
VGDYQECQCGQMIRLRMWHDRMQWVHVESGSPRCLGPFAEPREALRD